MHNGAAHNLGWRSIDFPVPFRDPVCSINHPTTVPKPRSSRLWPRFCAADDCEGLGVTQHASSQRTHALFIEAKASHHRYAQNIHGRGRIRKHMRTTSHQRTRAFLASMKASAGRDNAGREPKSRGNGESLLVTGSLYRYTPTEAAKAQRNSVRERP